MQCSKPGFDEESEGLRPHIYCLTWAADRKLLCMSRLYAEKHWLFRGIVGQTACKPGSVPARQQAGERWMTIPLGRPLPNASRDRPGRRRGNTAAGCPACRPYLVLLPGGVCPAASVAGRAVGSYPTVSPLPGWFAARKRAGPAVCFLWHFPWGRPRRPLAGTVSPWSPDFPHPLRSAVIQPSDPAPD